MSEPLAAAVAYAEKRLTPFISNGRVLHERLDFETLRLNDKYNYIDVLSDNFELSEEAAKDFTEASKTSLPAYIRCQDFVIYLLAQNKPLPTSLHNWLILFVESNYLGKEKSEKRDSPDFRPPRRRRGDKTRLYNAMIYLVALDIRDEFGLSLSSNEFTKNKVSASQAIVLALDNLGRAQSNRSVVDICFHPSHQETRNLVEKFRS